MRETKLEPRLISTESRKQLLTMYGYNMRSRSKFRWREYHSRYPSAMNSCVEWIEINLNKWRVGNGSVVSKSFTIPQDQWMLHPYFRVEIPREILPEMYRNTSECDTCVSKSRKRWIEAEYRSAINWRVENETLPYSSLSFKLLITMRPTSRTFAVQKLKTPLKKNQKKSTRNLHQGIEGEKKYSR